nr:InlB B-repeat-containing protein [Collinsella sp. D33t1_170424_A12]
MSYVINAREALKAAIDALELVKPDPQPVEYTVTFDYGYEGMETATVKVLEGQKVAKPADPTREGYVFRGWFNGDAAYDFDAAVKGDLVLTATWEKAQDPGTNPDKPGEKPDVKPENPSDKPTDQGGKPSGKPGSNGSLVQTGDPSMIALAAASLAGVAALGASAVVKRRR